MESRIIRITWNYNGDDIDYNDVFEILIEKKETLLKTIERVLKDNYEGSFNKNITVIKIGVGEINYLEKYKKYKMLRDLTKKGYSAPYISNITGMRRDLIHHYIRIDKINYSEKGGKIKKIRFGDAATKKKIKELREKGHNRKEISEILKVGYHTVSYHIREMDKYCECEHEVENIIKCYKFCPYCGKNIKRGGIE